MSNRLVLSALAQFITRTAGRNMTKAAYAAVAAGSVSKMPFFATLGPAAIADVTQMLRTIDLSARTMIIRKGQQGDCMYFIAAGEVEVELPGKRIALGEGAFFGEMALRGNSVRGANVTTTRISRLLVLDLVDFHVLRARHPDLAATIDAEAKRRAQENE